MLPFYAVGMFHRLNRLKQGRFSRHYVFCILMIPFKMSFERLAKPYAPAVRAVHVKSLGQGGVSLFRRKSP